MDIATISLGTGLGITILTAGAGYGKLQNRVKKIVDLETAIKTAQCEINESKITLAEIMIKLSNIELELQRFRTENNEVTRGLIKAIENISEAKK